MPIAIFGAGLVGQQWAMIFASKPNAVYLYDVFPEQLDKARLSIRENLTKFQEQGISRSSDNVQSQLARINFVKLLEDIPSDIEFVIESVPEVLELKQQVFRKFDDYFNEQTVKFSTSSYIPISQIVTGLKHQSNCMIAHPVNPPYFLRLVELCPSANTSQNTVQKVHELMNEFGQKTITVKKEVAGFCVNRIQAAVYNSVFGMLKEGIIDVHDVDLLMTEGLAPRWAFYGPMKVMDMNGPGGENYITKYLPSLDRTNELQGYPVQHNDEVKREIINFKTDPNPNLADERNTYLGNLMNIKKSHQN